MASAYAVAEELAERSASTSSSARIAAVVVTGLVVGTATAVLQQHLGSPWDSLVNAASPWLVPTFALGTLWERRRAAAFAGIAIGLLELMGYYVTAAARGYPAGHGILLFWTACAIAAGPVFGVAGWSWWRGARRLRGLGASVLPASFLAEAAVAYWWRLHYLSSALLFAALGVAVFAVLGLRRREHVHVVLWCLATFPLGVVAELVLGLVYRQSF